MPKLDHIFVIVNAEDLHSPALQRATALAQASGARLELAAFAYERSIAHWGQWDQWLMNVTIRDSLDALETSLNQRCKELQDAGVQALGSVYWGHPLHAAMAAQVAHSQPDLVIKDIGYAAWLTRHVLTPLDAQLLRLCPAPLMLVRHAAKLPQRVLAALDPVNRHDKPRGLNRDIIGLAQSVAELSQADLDLVAAYDAMPPLPYTTLELSRVERVYQDQLQQARKVFSELAAAHGIGAERCHFLQTSVIESGLQDFVGQHQADLLVVGTTYRKALRQAILGTVSEALLYTVDCDVLAVKPEGFAADLPRYIDLQDPDLVRNLRRVRDTATEAAVAS